MAVRSRRLALVPASRRTAWWWVRRIWGRYVVPVLCLIGLLVFAIALLVGIFVIWHWLAVSLGLSGTWGHG